MTADALRADFALTVRDVHRAFDLEASLRLEQGVLVLFGPSGSGKSLTIRALAGLIRPDRGSIEVRGRTVFDAAGRVHVPAYKRQVGYVPQAPSLFPFRNVIQNVLFGLPRRERRADHPGVARLMEELEIAHLAQSPPHDLSGGERQRVALARALAVEPRLLLLDEPFAAVDVDGRRVLRATLRATLERHGLPAVFVTHDPEEARSLADTVVRFESGRTLPAGTPAACLPSSSAAGEAR
jgi:molybdate transport system ATP-binding protein